MLLKLSYRSSLERSNVRRFGATAMSNSPMLIDPRQLNPEEFLNSLARVSWFSRLGQPSRAMIRPLASTTGDAGPRVASGRGSGPAEPGLVRPAHGRRRDPEGRSRRPVGADSTGRLRARSRCRPLRSRGGPLARSESRCGMRPGSPQRSTLASSRSRDTMGGAGPLAMADGGALAVRLRPGPRGGEPVVLMVR